MRDRYLYGIRIVLLKMFFYNDLYEVIACFGVFILIHGVLTYTVVQNCLTPTPSSASVQNDSLVNTLSELDTVNQVEQLPSHGYADAAVQTEPISIWATVKQWFKDTFSTRSSELDSIGGEAVKINKWRDKLGTT